MIDYSVYMQPNPLDETAAPKAYAKAQMRELMTFSKFINHIAQHNGSFSRGTVQGVISDACTCIVEQLLEGKKVQLGELGDFWISLTSNGAENMEKFTSECIKAVNIVFTPGEDFENLIGKAEFNVVASRIAQAATLKTEKAGGTTVDLEAARAAARTQNSGTNGSNPDSGSNTNGSTSTGDNSSGGNDTNSTPRLTINKSGTGSASVTVNGNAVNSGAEIAANTEVSISVTPAAGQIPTATLNGNSVTLTENDGTYTGTFSMPSANATLAINSGSTGAPDDN